jgi:hypothetical protein
MTLPDPARHPPSRNEDNRPTFPGLNVMDTDAIAF